MNKLLIGLLTLSIAGNAYQYFKPTEVVLENILPEKVIVKETETITVEDDSLKEKYSAVLAQLALTEEQLLAAQNELELIKDRQALAKLSEEVSDENALKAIEDGKLNKEFAEKMALKRENAIELFEKEPVDEAWAYQTQDTISKAIHEYGDTTLYEINELKCKSSVCKVTLRPFHKSEGAGMMAGMNASFALSKDEPIKSYRTSFKFDPEGGSQDVEMYIHKSD